MRLDDLRAQLKEIASRAPGAASDSQGAVRGRGRQLVRRRRIAQGSSALVAVLVVVGGVALWRTDTSAPAPTVVAAPPSSSSSTSERSTTASSTTVSSPTVAHPTVPPPTAPAVTAPTLTSPTTPADGPNPIPADDGYTFTSAIQFDEKGSAYALEAKPPTIEPIPAPFAARVVRIDLNSRKIAARSDQPNAAALVVFGNGVWVGVGRGLGGAFGPPAVTKVNVLDPATLSPLGVIALPGPGAAGLATNGDFLWALSGNNIVRIEPTGGSGRIASTLPLALPTSNPDRTLAVSGDGLHFYVGWSTTRQVEGVTEYDGTTGAKQHENPNVGGGPSNVGPALSFSGARLWATFPTGTEASAVALQASDLVATGVSISGPNSMSIAPFGDREWVSRNATLDCVDFHGNTLTSHVIPGGVLYATPTTGDVYASTGLGLYVVSDAGSCSSS